MPPKEINIRLKRAKADTFVRQYGTQVQAAFDLHKTFQGPGTR